jgi:hypothetical protein
VKLFPRSYTLKFGGSGNTSGGAAFSATGGINPIGATGGNQRRM